MTGTDAYLLLLAHLLGDYVIQSHWMATEKVKRWGPAVVHGLTYAVPFLLVTQSRPRPPRHQRRGGALAVSAVSMLPNMTQLAALAAHIDVRGPDDCWPWTGHLSHGYGLVEMPDGTMTTAHRRVYIEDAGPIPNTLVVDHLCHDPDTCPAIGDECPHRRCCNRRHLHATTVRINTLRGGGVAAVNAAKVTCPEGHPLGAPDRQGVRRCTPCARASADRYEERIRGGGHVVTTRVLTAEQIDAVRASELSCRAAARLYGVSVSTISYARKGWLRSAS